MKVLITGTNSYIGTSLLPVLLEKGHDIVCLVRNKRRFKQNSGFGDRVKIITGTSSALARDSTGLRGIMLKNRVCKS